MTKPPDVNYVIVYFGDNDFIGDIKEGLVEYFNYWSNGLMHDPSEIKKFLIEFVVGYCLKRAVLGGYSPDFDYRDYLDKIRVVFSEVKPPNDDKTMAAYDINLKYSWCVN